MILKSFFLEIFLVFAKYKGILQCDPHLAFINTYLCTKRLTQIHDPRIRSKNQFHSWDAYS